MSHQSADPRSIGLPNNFKFSRAFVDFFGCLLLFLAGAALLIRPLSAAAATEPLQVTMTVSKLSTDEAKIEKLISAEEAKPGDVLVYRATYHNHGKSTLREVVSTMPIPPSLTYLGSTAAPAPERASKEGRTYFPISATPKNAPPATWRSLRWAPRDLEPDAEFTVEFRAEVNGRLAR